MPALSLLTTESSAKTITSGVPKTPLSAKPTDSFRPPALESLCWCEAKARFRAKLIQTAPHTSQENIERFLKNNNRIDETISECEKLKNSAERQYNHSTSSRFIGKLLDVLIVVKSVGDPLLQCAPESVSIAWSAISLLIGLGANDIENCGRISEACTSIVTIVLNCRLYETRYQSEDASTRIIEAVQELLSVVLDFFWLANKKLRDKKIKRLFKDIFDSKVNDTYQDVITRYKALREDTEVAFQERVMESLLDVKKDNTQIAELLFPALKDITTKLEDLADVTKEMLTDIQVREKFNRCRNKLKPTDTHSHQLDATLQPLQRGTAHLCQWLFRHKHYQNWERISPKTSPKGEELSGANSGSERKTDVETDTAPPTNLLYVKGRAGFGKSVMMATVIERLRGDAQDSTDASYQRTKPKKNLEKDPVLYFFFKRGDDSTQTTERGFSSLLTQLFHEDHAKTREIMEKFINALDSLHGPVPESENEGHATGRSSTESSQNAPPSSSNRTLQALEAVAAATGKTVYIVIDGIDECTDYESEGLVKELVKLGRSKKTPFKILMSSREDMNLEYQFAKDDDPEGRKKLESAANQESNPEIKDPFFCVTHDDATILTVTKETNSEDMKVYLIHSLQELMKRRLPGMSRLGRADPRERKIDARIKKRLDARIRDIAEGIQKKSDGMFTYSAMVITTLGQPSPLSLAERLENLPNGMNELYSRQLEALTGAERKLVTLALNRIVWSPTDMGTVEIAEEFKQTYVGEKKAEKEDNIDDYDSESIDGNISEGDDLTNGAVRSRAGDKALDDKQLGNGPATRPHLHRAQTFIDENPIERAMRNPEIADTIYHLEGAGRDFFKFSDEKRTIGLIHKSVRDWFENESTKAAQRDYGIKSVASLFSRDGESGELKLTLPIPWIVVKGQSEAMEFRSEKDAHLDILIYILQVLTNPRFQEAYMPFYGLPDYAEKKDKPNGTADTKKSVSGVNEPSDNGSDQQNSNDDGKQAQKQDLTSEAVKPENGGDEGSEATTNGVKDDAVPNSPGAPTGGGVHDEVNKKETLHKGPWRCEIHEWIHHMKRIGQLWSRDERKGEKWTQLKDLLRKFSEPENFHRWRIQYNQWAWNLSLEGASEPRYAYEPIHCAGLRGLDVFVEYLITEAGVDPGTLSFNNRHTLHYTNLLEYPETVELILQKGIDLNVKDCDGYTPLMRCLLSPLSTSGSIDHDNEQVKKTIQSARHLINHGADLNEPAPTGRLPIQAIITIGDESLFDLAMEKKDGKVDVSLSDNNQRTALHVVWTSPNASSSTKVSIARKLLEAGANPNAQDHESQAPLLEAVLAISKEGVELLLEEKYGVDINDEDVSGQTALIAAAAKFLTDSSKKEDLFAIVDLLIKHGADIKPRAKMGWTAFAYAVYNENWEIAKRLMEAHSQEEGGGHSCLMQKDINDNTMLHFAAEDTYFGEKIAEFVLKELTAVEASELLAQKESTKGMTALHKAIEMANPGVAILALEHGADLSATNAKGESIRDTLIDSWANARSHPFFNLQDKSETWMKLFLAMMPSDKHHLILHNAISAGNLGIIKKLAETGIDPLQKDSENWDAFDWAYAFGRQEAIQELFPDFAVDYDLRSATWRDTFHPISRWDPGRSHKALTFPETDNILQMIQGNEKFVESDMSCRCTECKKGNYVYFAGFANHPVSPYTPEFYYEITILSAKTEKESVIATGFAGEGAPRDQMPGWYNKNVNTYGLHGDDGRLFAPECETTDSCRNMSKTLDVGEVTYGVGDTVGCGYDVRNHAVFWTLNGKYMGIGFENVRSRLYPVVGTDEWCSVLANFGNDSEKPFKWNGVRGTL